MKGSPEVIASLVAAAGAEAHLHLQYRMDHRALVFKGLKKVAAHFSDFGADTHWFLKKVTDRALFLGATPSYDAGRVTESASVSQTFANALALEMAIVGPYEENVQTAMKALDDTTRNLFEHLLKWHEKNIGWLEQQLALIEALGERDYIAEQL